ncbi:MAG: FAD-binding oxidoreductase [Ornithinimicrobium sp.]|uniref:NAD(P)/FAD-dependent oxidoreductase n=1 Tax=Ornithinimicrobium sp. TaxID=1977084 RepID=UPI0026DED419|nr:FAD-binding oxidoreductase [Ornithinimicrobium sp.]MDO5739997.1 FAD-binding oxidoreductase [Ornithinimicrobium sp.]
MANVAPSGANVVVIGGGVIGLSTAYQLAAAGVRDVVVLEQDTLGSGSTSKAAGGLRAQFSDEVNIALARRSLEVFDTFEQRFDQPIDLHKVGYLFLLDDAQDVADFEAAVALQNSLDVPSEMIEPAQAKALSPLIRTDGLLAASWHAGDGHCAPEAVVQGYARAARRAGARIITGCAVIGAEIKDGQIRAVLTRAGRIATEQVVCAAGAWSGGVAELFGVHLPVEPLRRQIVCTGPVPGRGDRATPMTIDFSTSFYFHDEGPGLLVGMSDPEETVGIKLGRDDGWLTGLAAAVERRAPRLAEAELRSGWAGLYEMTPDHNALIGIAADLPGFVYATGFSGHGFLMGPSVGEVASALVRGQSPVIDVTSLDVARFARGDHQPEKHIV